MNHKECNNLVGQLSNKSKYTVNFKFMKYKQIARNDCPGMTAHKSFDIKLTYFIYFKNAVSLYGCEELNTDKTFPITRYEFTNILHFPNKKKF